MITSARFLVLTLVLAFLFISCEKEALYNLSNDNYELRDSDSTLVHFPNDLTGDISVITFIYTNCPDVCPVITANMTNIQGEMEDTSGVNFIEISFDPERDTPSVLQEYKNLFGLNNQFTLLTGQPATIDTLLSDLDIVAEKFTADSLGYDSTNYAMRHSNIIYLMDNEGYIRKEYPAHRVLPEHVADDIQTLREE